MMAMAEISTPLERFTRWWVGELTGCIPTGWRRIGSHRSQALDVVVSPDRMTFRCKRAGKDIEIGEVGLDEADTPAFRALLTRIRRQINLRRAAVVLWLTPQQVLRPRIGLPLAAAENLREVLTYELDRHTPFQAEDIYFDFRVVSRDKQQRRISVVAVVVPRAIVDRAIALMTKCGMTPDRIDVVGDGFGNGDRIDLRGPSAIGRRGRLAQRMAAILMGLAVTLAGGAIYLEFVRQERTLAVYHEALEQRRAENLAADAMKGQLAEQLTRSQYIVQQKQGRPLVSALLDEVTRRIPDDTWLSQFHLEADRLAVAGYAPSASALIALLEESPLLSQVRFASPVTFDSKLGLERFNLSATIDPAGRAP